MGEKEDHNKIGDILDASHKGSISILDLVNGLKRLRGGNLKRSDVVSIDLMLRSLQEEVKEISRNIILLRAPRPQEGKLNTSMPTASLPMESWDNLSSVFV